MSESPTLTVPTAFNDISQLAEGLADRVDDERLMLYGPEPVEDNIWVRFAVLLMDQSIALEGVGRAVASIDGGDERPDVARFDIVLDNLQLEGTSEVVYERILMIRSQAFSEGPGTGEVGVEEIERAERSAKASSDFADEPTAVAEDGYESEYETSKGNVGAEDWSDEPAAFTEVGTSDIEEPDDDAWIATNEVDLADVDSVPPSAPPPNAVSRPPGFKVAIHVADGVLSRPSRHASWTPRLEPGAAPRPNSGLFAFSGGLPVPSHAPRPDIDPSMRVKPAPRPVSERPPANASGAAPGGDDYAEISEYEEAAYEPDDTRVDVESPDER